eukprot:766908-Prorocentrum_minimum.AAC.1
MANRKKGKKNKKEVEASLVAPPVEGETSRGGFPPEGVSPSTGGATGEASTSSLFFLPLLRLAIGFGHQSLHLYILYRL